MADIFVVDDFGPEALAMLQALYSRSANSVTEHIKRVEEKGSSDFMRSYYVGYGHSSIGDCGVSVLFFENVSILAAKAIQDNPLYSGQETSTRYLDFSKQNYTDPLGKEASRSIMERWLRFYENSFSDLIEHLEKTYPRVSGENARTWEKAIRARAFDILRGFLPAGMHTQLSWTTNLRQAHDKLVQLMSHPLSEVQQVAKSTLAKLSEKYPSSFSHSISAEQLEYYSNFSIHYVRNEAVAGFEYNCSIDNRELEEEALSLIANRPPRTLLPRFLSKYGRYHCRFVLDFGSFRDLQRHRNGICRMPLITSGCGFNDWYLNSLPENLKMQADVLLEQQFSEIDSLANESGANEALLQYYYPLGTNVAVELDYSLPQMVYVTELRSSSTVHPTLRSVALKMHEALIREHPKLTLYSDTNDDPWDIRRGDQDIIEK